MSELDTFARDAGHGVVPPDFEALVATSRRRRRRGVVATAAAIAVTVGIGVAGVQAVYDENSGPVPPADTTGVQTEQPTSTKPASREDIRLAEIVNHPDATASSVAVSTTDPAVKAVIWIACPDRVCRTFDSALAVTTDDFATTQYVPIESDRGLSTVVPLTDDTFFLVDVPTREYVVSTDGTRQRVTYSADPAPVADGEVLIPRPGSADHEFVIDPETAVAHPISMPAEYTFSMLHASPDLLWGVGTKGTFGQDRSHYEIWSDDGGVTWNENLLTEDENVFVEMVTGSDGDVLALMRGGDGTTMIQFDTVYRSVDGGGSWQEIDAATAATATLGGIRITSDGELLVAVIDWSGQDLETGLYRSEGTDWSTLVPVEATFPESFDPGNGPLWDFTFTKPLTDPPGDDPIWAQDANGSLFVSNDEGQTWTESATR